jgi:hypothetical protein
LATNPRAGDAHLQPAGRETSVGIDLEKRTAANSATTTRIVTGYQDTTAANF